MKKYTIKSNNDFINFLKTERYNQHLSQRQLGLKCGLKQQYISQIEQNRIVPKIDMIIKIAEALNYEINFSSLL